MLERGDRRERQRTSSTTRTPFDSEWGGDHAHDPPHHHRPPAALRRFRLQPTRKASVGRLRRAAPSLPRGGAASMMRAFGTRRRYPSSSRRGHADRGDPVTADERPSPRTVHRPPLRTVLRRRSHRGCRRSHGGVGARRAARPTSSTTSRCGAFRPASSADACTTSRPPLAAPSTTGGDRWPSGTVDSGSGAGSRSARSSASGVSGEPAPTSRPSSTRRRRLCWSHRPSGGWATTSNQELFGRPTDLPRAVEIDPDHRPARYIADPTFHPTFLDEATWNLILAAAIVWLGHYAPSGRRACSPSTSPATAPFGSSTNSCASTLLHTSSGFAGTCFSPAAARSPGSPGTPQASANRDIRSREPPARERARWVVPLQRGRRCR